MRLLYIFFVTILFIIVGIVLVTAINPTGFINQNTDFVYCQSIDTKTTIDEKQDFIDTIDSRRVSE